MNKVNILGTEYEVIKNDDSLMDCDGLCQAYSKAIRVRNPKDMLAPNDGEELKKVRELEVVRHEVVHAFFYESGLEDYCGNEQLVDWIAKQLPKINKAVAEVMADE